jgi:DNA-binding NarL/FixJ family response regulator
VEQALALTPDVILMDVRMPLMNGVEATAAIHRQLPACRVLMLTTFDDEEYVIQALQAGASGYLLKDIPAADLAQAVRSVSAGIYQLDPSVAGRLVDWLRPAGQAGGKEREGESAVINDHGLTERELQVLALLSTGASNREIAARVVVSEGTVKTHVSNILGRLGLRDRIQAALYARDHRLV